MKFPQNINYTYLLHVKHISCVCWEDSQFFIYRLTKIVPCELHGPHGTFCISKMIPVHPIWVQLYCTILSYTCILHNYVIIPHSSCSASPYVDISSKLEQPSKMLNGSRIFQTPSLHLIKYARVCHQ